jgi:hypothetical protein
MGAPELRHGVVTELQKDSLVQAFGPLGPGLPGHVDRDLARELVQVQPPQRAAVARVACEQRSLHDLRQVHDTEDGAIEVREVRLEQPPLLGRELFDGVLHGGVDATRRSVGPSHHRRCDR